MSSIKTEISSDISSIKTNISFLKEKVSIEMSALENKISLVENLIMFLIFKLVTFEFICELQDKGRQAGPAVVIQTIHLIKSKIFLCLVV